MRQRGASVFTTTMGIDIGFQGSFSRTRPETVLGLAGAGDLHVTGMAGRNRVFGELRGAGTKTAEVVERLKARDELTEGYAAIRDASPSDSGISGPPAVTSRFPAAASTQSRTASASSRRTFIRHR